VREGKANVKVVSNHGGGGGSLDWLALLFLLPMAAFAARRRV
jgi:hypothetical protein